MPVNEIVLHDDFFISAVAADAPENKALPVRHIGKAENDEPPEPLTCQVFSRSCLYSRPCLFELCPRSVGVQTAAGFCFPAPQGIPGGNLFVSAVAFAEPVRAVVLGVVVSYDRQASEALPSKVNSFHPSLRLAYKAIKSASAQPSCSLRQPGGIKFTPGKSRLQTSMDVFLSAVTENSFFHFCGLTSS